MIKILFFTSSTSDYLSDSLFHGFRMLFGSNVVDYPKAEIMYNTVDPNLLNRLHGRGFTCYGLLDNIEIDRFNIIEKVKEGFFDLIVISSIHRQFGFFTQLYPWLNKSNTIIIDGEDSPTLYKYNGNYFRHFYFNLLPNAHNNFLYFKREWSYEMIDYLYLKVLPDFLIKYLKFPNNLRPISFSIPNEKIITNIPVKTKLFASHIVDPEVRSKVEGASLNHIFEFEKDYYNDLQVSKFAITTKRAGWDCIRHYEIAANGCVMCFKDLDLKDINSAPHDLNDSNCIIYKDYNDLQFKINNITDSQYFTLLRNSLEWVNAKTTTNIVSKLLKDCNIIVA